MFACLIFAVAALIVSTTVSCKINNYERCNINEVRASTPYFDACIENKAGIFGRLNDRCIMTHTGLLMFLILVWRK